MTWHRVFPPFDVRTYPPFFRSVLVRYHTKDGWQNVAFGFLSPEHGGTWEVGAERVLQLEEVLAWHKVPALPEDLKIPTTKGKNEAVT